MHASNTMKVILIAPLRSHTGNASSAHRIRDILECNTDVTCELLSCHDITSVEELNGYIGTLQANCVLAIHAYRSGHLLPGCCKPYAVIFGGTDVNEHHQNKHKMEVMTAALQKARFVIAFSRPMMLKAKELWPDICDRIIQQPQGIITSPSKTFCFHQHLNTHYGVPLGSHIFLLVAGIRPVKDPLFLVKYFSAWHHKNETVWFVIVGPSLNEEFTLECKEAIDSLSGVLLIDCLPQDEAHAAIRDSTALINSSLSEGMCAAILEAMDLNTPVIARNIEGNAAIVQHRITGLLYQTPQEFIAEAKEILSNQTLRTSLACEAKKYVAKHHSVDEEKLCYLQIIQDLSNNT
ncbi:glycosyltransferase 1 domain-containing protein 1-like [Amphiura filiformis]|uniref:glycosyltransferase 1 domain-containing protein 1-like n=1 Tax=Amphiura filiformis TaxID=82378 RepID=UPI003B2158B2